MPDDLINLSATKSIQEIQIFRVKLRGAGLNRELDEDVLRAIDRAIAFPIIFELTQAGKRKTIASYKRPSEADSTKWVVSEYFGTEWEDDVGPRQPLPSALNLGALYDKLLSALIPSTSGTAEAVIEEPIAKRVERIETIRAKQREADRIKARLAREKQFNKRVAINAELRDVTEELKRLGATVKSVK
ncbi:MAG: DUF4391 domain-containing protein [Candidatus Sedimenticola sp. 6PFRAG7]